jgi:hypothetical protein
MQCRQPSLDGTGEIRLRRLAPVTNGHDPGRRCKKKALLGALVCRSHGGQLPSVRHAAARTVEEARLRLLLATDDAVAVLEYLMSEGLSEPVRLRASCEILDRAGIRGGLDIRPLPLEESPVALLEHRLAVLSQRMGEAPSLGAESGWLPAED